MGKNNRRQRRLAKNQRISEGAFNTRLDFRISEVDKPIALSFIISL